MKPCDEFRELIDARIDGEMSSDEARRLDEHLAACEGCRGELDRTERVWRVLGALEAPEVPAGLAERVYRRAVEERQPARRWGVPGWAWGPAAAAAAVVLVAFVLGYFATSEKPLDADTVRIVEDFDIIEKLDVLEHLDTLEQMGDGVLLLTTDPAKSEPAASPAEGGGS